MKVGVVDWGIGGLPTLSRLRAALPALDLAYWSDAGFTPYGKVDAPTLHARLGAIARALEADALVLACNAASTALAHGALPVPTLGIITPGIRMALASPHATIAVLGGERTIASGLHARALEAAGRRVIAVAAQPLSAHVEAGRLDGPELLADLVPLLARITPADAALLACTHYPALLPVLARLAPDMRWLDPSDALVDDAVTSWAACRGGGTTVVHTTGDPGAMASAAASAFAMRLLEVTPVTLPRA